MFISWRESSYWFGKSFIFIIKKENQELEIMHDKAHARTLRVFFYAAALLLQLVLTSVNITNPNYNNYNTCPINVGFSMHNNTKTESLISKTKRTLVIQ